jgi:hypothetical protein
MTMLPELKILNHVVSMGIQGGIPSKNIRMKSIKPGKMFQKIVIHEMFESLKCQKWLQLTAKSIRTFY